MTPLTPEVVYEPVYDRHLPRTWGEVKTWLECSIAMVRSPIRDDEPDVCDELEELEAVLRAQAERELMTCPISLTPAMRGKFLRIRELTDAYRSVIDRTQGGGPDHDRVRIATHTRAAARDLCATDDVRRAAMGVVAPSVAMAIA